MKREVEARPERWASECIPLEKYGKRAGLDNQHSAEKKKGVGFAARSELLLLRCCVCMRYTRAQNERVDW